MPTLAGHSSVFGVGNFSKLGFYQNLFIDLFNGSIIVEKDFCEKLLAKFNKEVDLVCTGHIKLNNLNKKISPWLPSKDISNNGMKDILYFTKHRNASQKMFKCSIIKICNKNIPSQC